MKRIIRLVRNASDTLSNILTGETFRHLSAAAAALLFAALRGQRLFPEVVPTQFVGTINLLEWCAGILGLFLIVMDTINTRVEKQK